MAEKVAEKVATEGMTTTRKEKLITTRKEKLITANHHLLTRPRLEYRGDMITTQDSDAPCSTDAPCWDAQRLPL